MPAAARRGPGWRGGGVSGEGSELEDQADERTVALPLGVLGLQVVVALDLVRLEPVTGGRADHVGEHDGDPRLRIEAEGVVVGAVLRLGLVPLPRADARPGEDLEVGTVAEVERADRA